MHLKLLSIKFDKEIRSECDDYKLILENCLNNNDELTCQIELKKFITCKETFISKFFKKYRHYKFKVNYE